MRLLPLCLSLILFTPTGLLAQDARSGAAGDGASGRTLTWQHAADRLADTGAANAMWQLSSPPRDSLKNGAIIGAIVGAASMFSFAMYLCQALKEPGDPSCFSGRMLLITGLGAGIGVGAGVGVDALLARQSVVRFSIRF